jgi:hypothetical protein
LTALHPAERRGALGGVTGHVAESVVEIVLESLGWTPVWHFLGPGRHGVDLLLLGVWLRRDRERDGDARSFSRQAVDRDRAAERLDSVLQTDEAGAFRHGEPSV